MSTSGEPSRPPSEAEDTLNPFVGVPLHEKEPALRRRALDSLPTSPSAKFFAPVKAIIEEAGAWAQNVTRGQIKKIKEARAASRSAATTPTMTEEELALNSSWATPKSTRKQGTLITEIKNKLSKRISETSMTPGSLQDLSVLERSHPDKLKTYYRGKRITVPVTAPLSPEKSKHPE